MRLRRLFVVLVAAAAMLGGGAGTAVAHPLGNFTVNHLDIVRVSQDRVEVRWILDQAEIPTFQERNKPRGEVLATKREEAVRGLELSVDGQRIALRADGPGAIAARPGQGGLPTTRVELLLSAEVTKPREVVLRDKTFSGRLGWRGMIAAPGEGTATTSSLPAEEPTRRLTRYPTTLLKSPADDSVLTLDVTPGNGTVTAPSAEGNQIVTTAAQNRGGSDGFAGLFADAASGQGVLVLLLFAAFGWGALHALSPGHGKAMVAAYLVGARGTARHAVLLGGVVTVTHTIGVFALGAVTLALSQYVLPEDLYPWLNLTSGLLVVLVGALVLRARLRGIPEGHSHGPGGHDHQHAHLHRHDHGHQHGPEHHEHEHDEHGHDHHPHEPTGDHDHHHDHHHEPGHSHAPDSLRPRVLLGAGASAGLIPCPSALVVLLAAVAQQQIALGLLLIVVFSLGLASTLTALGLIVVQSRRVTARWQPTGRSARLVAAVPAVSAVVIMVVGVALTLSAVPALG